MDVGNVADLKIEDLDAAVILMQMKYGWSESKVTAKYNVDAKKALLTARNGAETAIDMENEIIRMEHSETDSDIMDMEPPAKKPNVSLPDSEPSIRLTASEAKRQEKARRSAISARNLHMRKANFQRMRLNQTRRLAEPGQDEEEYRLNIVKVIFDHVKIANALKIKINIESKKK